MFNGSHKAIRVLLVWMNRSTSWRSLATMFKVTDSTFRGRLCRQHLGLFPWISTSLSINRADGREGNHADPQVASMASMHQSFSPFFFEKKCQFFGLPPFPGICLRGKDHKSTSDNCAELLGRAQFKWLPCEWGPSWVNIFWVTWIEDSSRTIWKDFHRNLFDQSWPEAGAQVWGSKRDE